MNATKILIMIAAPLVLFFLVITTLATPSHDNIERNKKVDVKLGIDGLYLGNNRDTINSDFKTNPIDFKDYEAKSSVDTITKAIPMDELSLNGFLLNEDIPFELKNLIKDTPKEWPKNFYYKSYSKEMAPFKKLKVSVTPLSNILYEIDVDFTNSFQTTNDCKGFMKSAALKIAKDDEFISSIRTKMEKSIYYEYIIQNTLGYQGKFTCVEIEEIKQENTGLFGQTKYRFGYANINFVAPDLKNKIHGEYMQVLKILKINREEIKLNQKKYEESIKLEQNKIEAEKQVNILEKVFK